MQVPSQLGHSSRYEGALLSRAAASSAVTLDARELLTSTLWGPCRPWLLGNLHFTDGGQRVTGVTAVLQVGQCRIEAAFR